jgi:hypothetical protein
MTLSAFVEYFVFFGGFRLLGKVKSGKKWKFWVYSAIRLFIFIRFPSVRNPHFRYTHTNASCITIQYTVHITLTYSTNKIDVSFYIFVSKTRCIKACIWLCEKLFFHVYLISFNLFNIADFNSHFPTLSQP